MLNSWEKSVIVQLENLWKILIYLVHIQIFTNKRNPYSISFNHIKFIAATYLWHSPSFPIPRKTSTPGSQQLVHCLRSHFLTIRNAPLKSVASLVNSECCALKIFVTGANRKSSHLSKRRTCLILKCLRLSSRSMR